MKVDSGEGGWREVLVEITVVNQGSKPIQIVGVFVKGEFKTNQIFPENIPSVLDPFTQVVTTIQKEWLDDKSVKSFGVVDALGKYHQLPKGVFENVITECVALPSERKKFRHKESGELVEAFQLRDRSSIQYTQPRV